MATSRAASAAPATIRITATPKKRLAVDLIGEVYMIKPPKTALLLAISSHSGSSNKDSPEGKKDAGNGAAVARDFDTILKLMFTPKDLPRIRERLESEDDELDLDHIFETVDAVTEGQTGDPTS